MPNKITDDEIIKALELCQLEDTTICESCPLGKFYPYCDDVISPATIDLINRQKAEIERLNGYLDVISYSTDKIKAKAVKECVEKAKEVTDLLVELMFDGNISKCQLPSCHKPSSIPCESEICIQENKEYWHSKLDNLLKEMGCDSNV